MKWIISLLISAWSPLLWCQEYYFRQMPIDFESDIQKIGLIFQASDQMIWLGTDRGLYAFDGRADWYISRPDGIPHEVTAIAEKQGGEIWAGYDDGFLHAVSVLGLNRTIPADSLEGISISKILFHEGDAFIATYGKGIWQINGQKIDRLTFRSPGQIDDVADAMFDRKGWLWLATDRGICIDPMNPLEDFRQLGREQGLPDEIVTKLLEADNGDVWIGLYDHGLGRYLRNEDKIITVAANEMDEGSVKSLVKGQAHDVWVGMEKSIGNYSLNSTHRTIQLPVDIPKHIESISFDFTENLWIASGNKLYMANTQLDHRIPDVTGIQTVAALNGELWLGCESGLYSMDQAGGNLIQHLQREQLNILSIYVDPEGFLWIGTFGDGLYIYDPLSGRTKHLTENDMLSNNSILNIDGYDNKIWLATLGGITQVDWLTDPFREKLTVSVFQKKFNFPAGYVYDVYVDENHKVWFGTYGRGLYYLDKDQFNSFNHPVALPGEDSLDLKTIYSVTTDINHHLWISTIKGNVLNFDLDGNLLSHISSSHGSENSLITSGKGEVIMVREGGIQIKDPAYGVFSFSSSNGLNSFSPSLNAIARDKDGSVWIADADNILHYLPSLADTARYVHMQLVDVSPGAYDPSEIIRLKPDSNYLDLKFTGLWFPDPTHVQYRYMLKGHDLDWIYTQEGRAVYSKLSPGAYTFMVAGSYNGDFSNAPSLQHEILVLPPFYLTWWFISGGILLISLIGYLIIRGRIQHFNKLHELEKEKTTLQLHAIQAQVNPHFLFNSFNTLSSIIEEDQKSAVAYVDQLSGFFRGVLMHRNEELITLAEEIIIMRNYNYILQKRYGDNIRIVEQLQSREGYIAPLSIQLLVENAIKHNKATAEKPLTIHITVDDKWVVVSNPIRQKIQSLNESTGFGLSSLLTRYQYLTKSKIEINNDGKTFTVKIPIIHPN